MRTPFRSILAQKRRRWPRRWRLLHLVGIVGSLAALLSGSAVVLPFPHRFLIPWLMALRLGHSTLGLALAALLGVAAALAFPHRRNRLDWLPVSALLGVLTASGLLLLLPPLARLLPAAGSLALPVHLWASAALLAFVLLHGLRKLGLLRIREGPFLAPRRDFLAGVAKVFFLAAAATFVAPGLLSEGNAEEGRGSWQIYSVTGTFPYVPPERFRLTVEGLVAAPKVYRFADLTRLPVARVRHTFWCVTGWSVRDVLWEGVLVSSLLADLELLDGAKAVVFFSADGTYVDSLTLAEVYASGTLLAWKMDGAPLSALHGGPVRLVVPKMYGYKSVKWVERIALAEFPPVGTWEAYGYPAAAWVEEDASARGSRSG